MKETRGCDNCKHCDKKITEEPCYVCDGWHSRWEANDNTIDNMSSALEEVTKNAKTAL